MRIMREGVRAWCVEEVCGADFFLEMEYRMIRRHHPRSLLSMQLKEEDNKKMIFYEISGKKSLSTEAKNRGLTGRDCIRIMEGLLRLQNDLDELMLKIGQVMFDPEYIFYEQEAVTFLYLPQEQEDIPGKIESFFSWILSAIDYDDTDAVRFMYQVFWRVRSRGYSKDLIIQCLAHVSGSGEETAPAETGEAAGRVPAEPAGHAGTRSRRESEDKRSGDFPVMWLMLIPALLSVFVGIFMIVVGIRYGFTVKSKALIMACFLLAAAAVSFSLGSLRGKRKKEALRQERRQDEKEEEREQRLPSSYARWDDEKESDKTEILSFVAEEGGPYLQNPGTGEIHMISGTPFHIGSEEALNQLVPGGRTISREHAVIYGGRGGFFIQDLGSTNGTWLEGKKLDPEDPVFLPDGARLRFAGEEYTFHMQG